MERMTTMTATTFAAQGVNPVQPPSAKAVPPRVAAERAVARHSVTFDVFGFRAELPSADQLAFLAGIGVLTALEIIEWPVAVVLAVGHQLAHSHHGRVLREFGDALEEA